MCDARAAAAPRKEVWRYERSLILRGFKSDPESQLKLLNALADST